MTINTPEWVKNAVFYQIFPDRFARSQRINHPRGLTFKAWGAPPEEQGFQGGDLLGVVDKLDYLQELGVTAIYLCPIFSSASNHRYHTFDYMQVDPLLGGNAALRELLDEAHARNIKVVLDGVFNHASRGFWAFHHILEAGGNSPYLDWFHIEDWPLSPYPKKKKEKLNYKAWWNLAALPKFNTDNPGVRDYIMQVARYWLEFGIDGWRLDVPGDIDDDSFWQEFRQVVKGTNPETYICGEIWDAAQRWLQGDQFDAVMNYIFTGAIISFCGGKTLRPDYEQKHLDLKPLDAPAFAQRLDHMHSLYAWEINHVQLNLLDSHDMARALWIMGEDKTALQLAVLFQMTLPGAPCIYYGGEIGLSGGTDPHCRQAFPWQAPETWDNELLAFYRQATALRHAHPVLRTGTFRFMYAQGMVYAFSRQLGEQTAIVIFNADVETVELHLDLGELAVTTAWVEFWPQVGRSYQAAEGQLELTLPPRQALVLGNS